VNHTRTHARRSWSLLGVAAVLAMLMTAISLTDGKAAKAASVYEWNIRAVGDRDGTVVYPGTVGYKMLNYTNWSQYLTYGSRSQGINLVWKDYNETPNIRIDRQSGSGPLTYGEPVAIYVQGGGYLRYGVRSSGINLVWSSSAVYEWRIHGQDKMSGAVMNPYDYNMALYNTRAGAHVVYGERSYGINLVWAGGAIPPSTATVSLGHRLSSTVPCTGSVSFRLTPVSLNGSDGIGTATTVQTSGETRYPSGGYCYWTVPSYGLRTGTWRIDLLNPAWPVSCQIFLGGGTTSANFTQGRYGCTTGLSYP